MWADLRLKSLLRGIPILRPQSCYVSACAMLWHLTITNTKEMKDSSYVFVSRDGSVYNENISNDGNLKYLPDLDKMIEGLREPLWHINKHIHDNPELGFEEYDAQTILTDFLRSQDGWGVATSVHGMNTAWIASYDSKKQGPVVSFNVEMGALIPHNPFSRNR
jgi:hypothetical protein